MEYIRITSGNMDGLKALHIGYKQEIGEEPPTDENFESLSEAIQKGQIIFYGCADEGRLIACCSITPTYSTFNYQTGGVFEDFYIVPEYRHKGIARQLSDLLIRKAALVLSQLDVRIATLKCIGR